MSILLVIAASSIALAAEDPVATSSDWNKVCFFTLCMSCLDESDNECDILPVIVPLVDAKLQNYPGKVIDFLKISCSA